MYSSTGRFYAKSPVFEIVHEESVKVYHLHMYTGIFSMTLYAQNPASLRNFTSLPGSRLRFSIAMQCVARYVSIMH